MIHHKNRRKGKRNKQVVESELKINSALKKGPTQVSFIGKTFRDKIGPQPAPARLRPKPPAYLKFETSLKLIALVLA